MGSESIKISARDVWMDYAGRGAGQHVRVLEHFDLDVREGEFLSVLGPSGCGKSTFLSLLAGLTTGSGGRIAIDGRPLVGINRQQGAVFQGYALFPWRTVLDNIAIGLEIRGVGRAERRRTAQHYLALPSVTRTT